jgi:hypothetical protein
MTLSMKQQHPRALSNRGCCERQDADAHPGGVVAEDVGDLEQRLAERLL